MRTLRVRFLLPLNSWAELAAALRTEEAERLRDEGANIHHIVLENELNANIKSSCRSAVAIVTTAMADLIAILWRSKTGQGSTTFPATTKATSSSPTFASSLTSLRYSIFPAGRGGTSSHPSTGA